MYFCKPYAYREKEGERGIETKSVAIHTGVRVYTLCSLKRMEITFFRDHIVWKLWCIIYEVCDKKCAISEMSGERIMMLASKWTLYRCCFLPFFLLFQNRKKNSHIENCQRPNSVRKPRIIIMWNIIKSEAKIEHHQKDSDDAVQWIR